MNMNGDGKLKKWEGDTSEVYSTISSDPNKPYAQTLLGSIPDMDSDSALEALESAKKAFNRGQGKWPTMKVRDRLKCMMVCLTPRWCASIPERRFVSSFSVTAIKLSTS